jgi:tetratricopeptide (TPR) repeat protein
MSIRGATPRLTQLWQLPLLALSTGLLICAACLFVDASPGLALHAKIDQARAFLQNERPQAAVEHLNRLLASETLSPASEAPVHLLIADAMDAEQAQSRPGELVADRGRIIEQIQIALAQGAKPSGEIYARLGANYEALGRPVEAVSNYREAIAVDPARALRLQRKIIDLQISQSDWAPAEASLDGYLVARDLTATERAWGLGEKAQLLIDRGECADARPLLDEAMRLDPDPIAQGVNRYRLGLCAWKSGKLDEAERLLRAARAMLKSNHPLDPDAACALGQILQEKRNFTQAIVCYTAALAGKPAVSTAAAARLGRGMCSVHLMRDDAAVSDLRDLGEQFKSATVRATFKIDCLASLRQIEQMLSARENYQAALDVLALEPSIEPDPPVGYYERLSQGYERRAEQVEQNHSGTSIADSARRSQSFNDLCTKAADAQARYCRALIASGDAHAAEALWKTADLYARAGNRASVIATLETFISDHPTHPAAPDALLRLARAHENSANADGAIAAYQRLWDGYPHTAAALHGVLPLARALASRGPSEFGRTQKLLVACVDAKDRLAGESETYKLALLELAQLEQRAGRADAALRRFEQFVQLYPEDPHTALALFAAGQAQRALALKTDGLASASASGAGAGGGAADVSQVAAARRQRLGAAAKLFDRVLEIYKAAPPINDADKQTQQRAIFCRADCAYDLESFSEARALYASAADQYHDDASAFAAAVQIVNCCAAMDKPDEAAVANERAQALLHRLGPDAGGAGEGNLALPKAYLEQWMKWTSGGAGRF